MQCITTQLKEKIKFASIWMNIETIMLSNKSDGKNQEPHDFTHVWDIGLKTTKEQKRKEQTKTHRRRQQ